MVQWRMTASTFIPEAADGPQLTQLAKELATLPEGATLYLQTSAAASPVAISPLLSRLLRQSLQEFQQGHALTLIPTEEDLSTFEAANLLGVSRPFLISNLLEAGVIPFHMVGTHRRIALREVQAYQQEKARQHAILDELAALDQEMGLI